MVGLGRDLCGSSVGSCSAGCQPTAPGLFPLGSFPATLPQACSIAWGCCDQSAGPGTWPRKPHTISLGPLIQTVRIPLQCLSTLRLINTPSQLGVIWKLTAKHSVPSSRSSIKMLNKTGATFDTFMLMINPFIPRHYLLLVATRREGGS